MNHCPDCGKPMYEDSIHTCTPKARRLADAIRNDGYPGDEHRQAADELERLYCENERLKTTQYGSGRLQALRDQRKSDETLLRQALEALILAQSAIEDWGCYASEYFQKKHDLEGDVAGPAKTITALRERLGEMK